MNKSMDGTDRARDDRVFTLPNALCAIRLVASPILLVLAIAGQARALVIWFIFLALTDWVDGKLARSLDQRSVFGARLDSWADAALYTFLLLSGLWLRFDVLASELAWVGTAVGSYVLTTSVGLWKFGRWPSYHTRAAKICWLLITVGAVCLLAGWSVWPFRLATLAVTFTNLEATMITCVLPSWQADVPSLFHAWRYPRPPSDR